MAVSPHAPLHGGEQTPSPSALQLGTETQMQLGGVAERRLNCTV